MWCRPGDAWHSALFRMRRSGALRRLALLAHPCHAPGQHLGVLLLVLAQHLRHRDQGLDLRHLVADVQQLSQVRVTDVVNSGQVSSRVTLRQWLQDDIEMILLTDLDPVLIRIWFVSD